MVMPSAAADWQASSKGGHGLRRPVRLGAAPTDGDDRRRTIRGVVNSRGQRIEETLGAIGGEVDGYIRSGGDGAGDFDVECDLTVGVRVAGVLGRLGELVAPSTETAVTRGSAMPSPAK